MKIGLALLAISSACDPTTEPTMQPCVGSCINDPIAHCIDPVQCGDDADCPSGLTCDHERGNSACFDPNSPSSCVWRVPRLNHAALTSLEPRALPIELRTEPLRVRWTVPSSEVTRVSCAVFTCNPVIRSRVAESEADRDALQQHLQVFANAEACIREFIEMDASRLETQLGSRTIFPGRCDSGRLLVPAIDFLAVGCWAFDAYHVIATSELVEISPEDYASTSFSNRLFAPCGDNDGATCYEPTHKFFGRCDGGHCQFACVTAEDCDVAARTIAPQPGSDACQWKCVYGNDPSVVGRCVPNAVFDYGGRDLSVKSEP